MKDFLTIDAIVSSLEPFKLILYTVLSLVKYLVLL